MGLVHALRSSAEVALGDDDGPLRARAERDGVRGSAAARRSLDLLEMLQAKTAGNLVEAERDLLWTALRSVRARLERAEAPSDEAHELPMAPPTGPDPTPGGGAA